MGSLYLNTRIRSDSVTPSLVLKLITMRGPPYPQAPELLYFTLWCRSPLVMLLVYNSTDSGWRYVMSIAGVRKEASLHSPPSSEGPTNPN